MKMIRAAVVPLMILASAGACASAPAAANSAPAHVQPPETTVRVTNNNWSTAAVYVVRLGMRTRIGTVESMRTEVLQVPRALIPAGTSIQLLVDPIGSRTRYLTPMIQVVPGQEIAFQIENHLPLSSVSVWHR